MSLGELHFHNPTSIVDSLSIIYILVDRIKHDKRYGKGFSKNNFLWFPAINRLWYVNLSLKSCLYTKYLRRVSSRIYKIYLKFNSNDLIMKLRW